MSPGANRAKEEETEIDYSKFKGYFGKGRPVTVYAQFIYANRNRYQDDFYEYVTKCAKIWKNLREDQREIFVDASKRDVIRYRTGKKIPRKIKTVKTVTSKLPDGPIKRKITGSKSKDDKEGTPSKKRRLSTPKRKAASKKKKNKKIKKASSPKKKRSVSSRPKAKTSLSRNKNASSPKKKRSISSRPSLTKKKSKVMTKKSQWKAKITIEKNTQGTAAHPSYNNYKTYFGKRGPVTTYAQFIHANKSYRPGKPFMKECSSIWDRLDESKQEIFKRASDKDVERYRKSSFYRSKGRKY